VTNYNVKPEGLSKTGTKAYEVIMSVLKKHDATYTGGCKSFYSPAEWKGRGEEFGLDAELIVVYDGGSLPPYFSLDHSYPHYTQYEIMRQALEAEGLYFEECTGWYAAIYKL